MNSSIFTHFKSSEMILRDHLALERTALANERTLLAYVRTMIGIVAVGGTLIKLFTEWQYILLGWSCIGLGFAIVVIGFKRYIRIDSVLSHIALESSDLKGDDTFHRFFWELLHKLRLARVKNY